MNSVVRGKKLADDVTRDMDAVHWDDIGRYVPSDRDLGWWLIGNDCARILGMEWTLPEIVP